MSDPAAGVGRSNCLLYALRRWRYRDDYLLIRRSRWGWWPHFLHGELDEAGRVVVDHLVPTDPIPPKGWRRFLPVHALLFRGRVHTDDTPQ